MSETTHTPQTDQRGTTRPPRTEEGRRLVPAGRAIVVAAVALLVSVLLNADGLHKTAYNQNPGTAREVSLALTGAAKEVSHALLLDQPRRGLKLVLGRGDDDEIDTAVAVPAPPPPEAPKPAAPAPTAPPGPPPKPAFSPDKPLRLWIAGDSLVITPGYAIIRAAGGSRAIRPVGQVDGRVATGLERPDVFNWFTHVRNELRAMKPKAVVLAFGGNDDHGYMTGLPQGREIDGFGEPAWRREYRRRVGGLMDLVNRAGAYLVWIGLPITRDADQSRRFDVINAQVAAEALERPRSVTYLDTYTMFASSSGGFAQYLPDALGRERKVRADDGVHFDRSGGDMIAREVLRRLNQVYDLTSWRRPTTGG